MRRGSPAIVQLAGGAAIAALALATGLLPVVTSTIGALIVCSCGLLAVAIILIHRLVPSRPTSPAAAAATDPLERPDPPELRLARLLFYVGTLLVGESYFRFGGLTLSEVFFILAFVVCVFATARGNPVPGVPTLVLAAVGVFTLGGAISSLDAQSPSGSAFQVVHAAYVLLLWPAVGAMLLRTRRHFVTAITLWVGSAAIDGLGALSQLFGFSVLGIVREGDRMTGFTTHANDLGGVASVALVPALLVATGLGPASAPVRALRWAAAALVAVALVLSGSVAGMGAGALAVLIWLSSSAVRAPARVAVVAAVVCALAVVVVSGNRVASPLTRLAQVTSNSSQANNGSAQDRLSVARQAWPRIASDPFVGTGLDASDSNVTIISHAYSVPYQIHGLPLAAWYETGLFGLLGSMGLLVVLVLVGWRGLQAAPTADELLLGWTVLAAFGAFVVEAMTQPMVFQQYGWLTSVMIVAWSRRVHALPDPVPRIRPRLAGLPLPTGSPTVAGAAGLSG